MQGSAPSFSLIVEHLCTFIFVVPTSYASHPPPHHSALTVCICQKQAGKLSDLVRMGEQAFSFCCWPNPALERGRGHPEWYLIIGNVAQKRNTSESGSLSPSWVPVLSGPPGFRSKALGLHPSASGVRFCVLVWSIGTIGVCSIQYFCQWAFL